MCMCKEDIVWRSVTCRLLLELARTAVISTRCKDTAAEGSKLTDVQVEAR